MTARFEELKNFALSDHFTLEPGYRILGHDDVLREGDENNFLALMRDAERHWAWKPIPPGLVGKTVEEALASDFDSDQWMFRRRTSEAVASA